MTWKKEACTTVFLWACTNELHRCPSNLISWKEGLENLQCPWHPQAVLLAGSKVAGREEEPLEMRHTCVPWTRTCRKWLSAFLLTSWAAKTHFWRTFGIVGFASGGTDIVVSNLTSIGVPRCRNPVVSARWNMLFCGWTAAHTMLTAVLFHQLSAISAGFLCLAAPSLFCFFFFPAGLLFNYLCRSYQETLKH